MSPWTLSLRNGLHCTCKTTEKSLDQIFEPREASFKSRKKSWEWRSELTAPISPVLSAVYETLHWM